MRSIISISLLFVPAVCVFAYPHSSVGSELSPRTANTTMAVKCLTSCKPFVILERQCDTPQCFCTTAFLQAQVACSLCLVGRDNPGGAASVHVILDAEIKQCRRNGVDISFQLQLPPAAAAIVHGFETRSERLRQDQIAFLALQIVGGHVGLVLLLVHGVFSRRVDRDPTMFNFCLTWIFSSIAFSLLLYRGTEGNTSLNTLGSAEPNICLAQAALTSGAQVMTACSTLALVTKLWLRLRATIHGDLSPMHARLILIGLLATPYIFALAFAFPVIFLGSQRVAQTQGVNFPIVFPTNFYCMILNGDGFPPVLYGMTLGLHIVTLALDGFILRILYRHLRAFRTTKAESSLPLSTLLRVTGFSIYRIMVAFAYGTILVTILPGLRVSMAVTPESALTHLRYVPRWIDLLQATTPLAAFLILGTSQDRIATLVFWKRKRQGATKA